MPDPCAQGLVHRVAVKLRDDLVPSDRLVGGGGVPVAGWSSIASLFPGLVAHHLFADVDTQAINELVDRARATSLGYRAPNFQAYFAVRGAIDAQVAEVASRLESLDGVEWAYVAAGPTPPPQVDPSNDLQQVGQRYQDRAAVGIDAEFAWTVRGGDGAGVGFIDVEQGWVLDHEDLVAARIALVSGANCGFFGHGTAVLGQVCGVDNTKGIVGIAPACSARVVSQFQPNGYNTAQAVLHAASVSRPGDVVLLEAQTTVGGRRLPVEAERAEFDAIELAVAAGVIVVEASNNGNGNLDRWSDARGRRPFDRSGRYFRDSGAIVVGAGSSGSPHRRLACGFGSRIDCYAWGENVVTAGDGHQSRSRTAYTPTFRGTSSASAIVAGAALCVQGAAIAAGLAIGPHRMRALLSDATLGTASSNPQVDQIGVMPDLKRILPAVLRTAARVPPKPAGAGK